MQHQIFVSYKYWDPSVYQDNTLDLIYSPNSSNATLLGAEYKRTPRSYLNRLSKILCGYAIEKWEKDDEDLSNFREETIESKLRDKIYHSTITIVLISPGMMDFSKSENDQWIPWEISYSLKEVTRNEMTSHTNSIITVVLPDTYNSYNYFIPQNPKFNSTNSYFESCFKILKANFFNLKNPNKETNSFNSLYPFAEDMDSHYFVYATWENFIHNPGYFIRVALKHSDNLDNYEIHKEV